MGTELRIDVCGWNDATESERAALAQALRGELLRYETVKSVTFARGAAASGAKGTEVELATLILAATGDLPGLAAFLHGWVHRKLDHRRRPASVLLVDAASGDTLRIDGASDAVQMKAIEVWDARARSQ